MEAFNKIRESFKTKDLNALDKSRLGGVGNRKDKFSYSVRRKGLGHGQDAFDRS